VFARVPLEGNPVAVFPDASGLEAELMQRTARELNLSETVFLLSEPCPDAPGVSARIFTPTAELPFAGHPLLGAAIALAEADPAAPRGLVLRTAGGAFPVGVEEGNGGTWHAELEHAVPVAEPFAADRELLGALGVTGSELPVEAYRNGPLHVYVALADERRVAELEPDLPALARLGPALGVNCFAAAGGRVKARMFAPALGVAEDPATGSAAGPLAVHLTRHGAIAPGDTIDISQGEEIGRPSLLHARVEGEKVAVSGAGFVVAHGEYRLG
jgi:trans-2,3-dihydro-3-hydroxyanthranilate isomerase